jgi:hypothetical protein
MLMTSAALLLFALPAIAAEPQTVEVEGLAAVVNNDIAHARDKAIDDAKRRAVEQVAGTQVSSQSISENFQLVEDKIYARSSGFVKNFSISSELKDGETYRVKIKATVDANAIAENLDLLFKAKPRVIVMIAEQNVGGKNMSYWWGNGGFSSEMDVFQTTLIGEWQPKGFKFIEPGMLRGKLKVGKAMTTPELSNADALTLSKGADADIAIVGKVLVTDAGPVMEGVNMHSFHAVGTVRVLNVDTGEIIAVADETGVAPHIDANMGGRLAIKALAQKLNSDVEKKILSKWTADAASAMSLELIVANAKSSKVIDELTRVMSSEVRGVESATLRRRNKGNAYYDVRFRGDAMGFAREMEGKAFKDFAVEVENVSKAKVKLAVSAGK